MGADHGLDLLRIDVEARADDELLGPADDEQGPVGLDAREIARVEPALRRENAGGLGLVR
jgi:hypothetical protein